MTINARFAVILVVTKYHRSTGSILDISLHLCHNRNKESFSMTLFVSGECVTYFWIHNWFVWNCHILKVLYQGYVFVLGLLLCYIDLSCPRFNGSVPVLWIKVILTTVFVNFMS